MKYKDLRAFIAFLEEKGELRRIKAPVSCELEITEIADRMVKRGGPALLFEQVTGYDMPVLINLFASQQRMAWALGVDRLEDLVQRFQNVLQLMNRPPEGVVDKLRTLGQVVHLTSFQPRTVRNAPCQEIVLPGEEVDLFRFPIAKCWPLDGGRYITLPLVITKDPVSGIQNYGTYRLQVYDARTTGMHWQTHKVGAHHYRVSQEQNAGKLEVAVALGGDPATIWTGSAPLPPDMDEMAVAGFIRDEGVDLVRAKTVDLMVPAQAEIVLEGYVVPGEERTEGPFGDHTGYYSMEDEYPVFHVTTITHRRNPIYPTAIVGRPPMEDYWMGKVTERVFMPLIQLMLPEVVDMNMPAEGVFHNLVIVSIKKEYPGQARKVMHGLWGMGLMSLAKAIVVVDHFVNVQDPSEVAWRVASNLNPGQDLVLVDGPLDDLDHASPTPRFGSKIGIDATHKIPGEGHPKEWPPEVVMIQEIKELVDRKWADYGIEAPRHLWSRDDR
ncbi:MAG: menaquinone biosynthesis decarboxylase [Dehalococcoidia bacterium]